MSDLEGAAAGLGQPKRLEQQEEAVEEVELMEDSPVLDERREPDSSDLKSSPAGELLEFSTATTTEDDKGDGERRTSMNSDDLLYEDSLAESKPLPPGSAADDVLLELNSEEQEQFEVIDAAGGQEGQQEAGSTAEDRGGKEEPGGSVQENKEAGSSEMESKTGSQNSSPASSSASGRKESKSREREISPIVFKHQDGSQESEKPAKAPKDKGSSGSHRITDKLFSNTRYFVIKSNNYDNVDIAKSRSVWSTPPYNEKKLNKAYRDCRNVLLIFSVRESGRFQGIARLMSESRHDSQHVPWVLPPGISQSQLGGIFRLDWIHKGAVEFSVCMDLKNPWNDNKPVKISRDGQEVEPTIGEKLCRLWQSVEGEDGVLSGSRTGGARGESSRHGSSFGHGSSSSVGSSSGGHAPFPPGKGQPHMYPPPHMYFPYHQSMQPSMYPGSGDSRNPMAMSAFFSQPPRLGFPPPAAHHPHHGMMPPAAPLHSMGGGGSGAAAYSRPGRPWWTVPSFPPPSHLHHHPHQPHNQPLLEDEQNLLPQDEQLLAPTAAAASDQQQQPCLPGAESPVASPKTVVPRTSSRNAYSQQRQSILKKQQQHQALKAAAGKKQAEANGKALNRNFILKEEESKMSALVKNLKVTEDARSPKANDEKPEQRRGMKLKDESSTPAKKGGN